MRADRRCDVCAAAVLAGAPTCGQCWTPLPSDGARPVGSPRPGAEVGTSGAPGTAAPTAEDLLLRASFYRADAVEAQRRDGRRRLEAQQEWTRWQPTDTSFG